MLASFIPEGDRANAEKAVRKKEAMESVQKSYGVTERAGQTQEALKILFVAIHIGYIRNFESTIRLLAKRGHHIHLAFMRTSMRKQELGPDAELLLKDLCDNLGVTASLLPETTNFWTVLSSSLRLTQSFLRYLRPEFRHAPKLRQRAEQRAPTLIRLIFRLPLLRTRTCARLLTWLLRRVEMAIPVNQKIVDSLQQHQVDLLLVTPLVELASTQTDWVKAAKALGIPTMLPVASWDNLTNKGNIPVIPDLVVVWNPPQRTEAIELHGVPPAQVMVTGAEAYDHWFEWQPSRTSEEFCRVVGLDPHRPYILYVGSSVFIAGDETDFVRTWINKIRSSSDPIIQDIGILIRPHPQNFLCWEKFDLTEFSNVVIWPRRQINPLLAPAKRDYYDSLYHSSAVMGINTTALIEAAIIGRQVFSLLHEQFKDTQEGTIHFHHLINSEYGVLYVSRTFEEHLLGLSQCIKAEVANEEKRKKFIETFIRPHGVDIPATPLLVDSIEQLGAKKQEILPIKSSRLRLLALLLFPIARLSNKLLAPRSTKAMRKRLKKRVSKKMTKSASLPVKVARKS